MKRIKVCIKICFLFLALFVVSCSSDGSISNPETKVKSAQEASEAINKALEEGKIVKSVLSTENNGWILRFKNGTSIIFDNSDFESITPYITIGSDSCWYVSEDQGDTYTYLKGTNDGKINAFDNIKESDKILNDIVLPKHKDSQSLVKAIIENNYAHTLSLGLLDGKIYSFKKTENIFQNFSIKQEDNRDIPNDFVFCIGMNKIVAFTPYIFDKTKLIARYSTPAGNKVYVKMTEQTSGVSTNNFNESVNYNIVSPDGDNNVYTVLLQHTGLPVVIINTPDNKAITSKTDWMDNAEITIYKEDGTIDYTDNKLQIRGRGNSTWGYPKKPYALKLSKKSEILGMPKHKRWVLLANWMDRTLMRNEFAFEIARNTDLEWTPRGRFVEVILNGKHVGNYYLCEQIKIDENRVNVAEMKETDTDGDNVTGGYLMELDVYYDEVNKFKSAHRNLPYMFKEPDENVLQPAQMEYLKSYVDSMESFLYAENWLEKREYINYMDVNSFIDWWFVYELAENGEPGWPKSSYMHKDRLGKLTAGPVWDFDWGTFIPNRQSFSVNSAIYYGRLFQDPDYLKLTKDRWQILKPKFETIPNKIRAQAESIRRSEWFNHELWPITITVNEDEDLSFKDAINRMINAYESKLKWMDQQINGF